MTRICCSHCGHETAKIVYRIPTMTTQLQKDIDDHKIYLVRGKTMPPSSRYCFHCHKDVCYSFLPIDETSTTSVESEMGGFYEGYQKIAVKKIKDRFVDSYSDSIGTLGNQASNMMFTLLEIKRIILLPKNEYLPKIGNRIMTEPTNCVKLCL